MAKTIYRTIAEQIADLIRTDIFSGVLAENSMLKEQELSDRFSVSRGTVRHALMHLVTEGVVISTPNIGMRVAGHPSEEALRIIIEVRNRIEESILRFVFDDLGKNHMEGWRTILEEMKKASLNGDIEVFIGADIRFHRFFVALYPDTHVTDLWEAARSRMMMRYNRLKDIEAGYQEHLAIYESVARGDLELAVSSLHSNVI